MNLIQEHLYPLFLKSTGISTDTRKINKGNIFFALKGPNFNGNQYAQKAFQNGASAVILDEFQESLDESENVIYVDNVLLTLQSLALYHRKQLKAHVIGLTGSNGKTTTKELLYGIFKKYNVETYCTYGNLNNHIGVPLTILSIPLNAKYAIVEMGTNQPGDIAELAEISLPDYGLITNIGKAHLEKLINQEGVFIEKTSLFHKVEARDGVIFLNVGDRFLQSYNSKRSIQFTSKQSGDYSIEMLKGHLELTFSIQNGEFYREVTTNLFGSINVENIVAALTIAEHFSIPIETSLEAIEEYLPSNMRSQIVKTDKGNTIVLDAYNSNPISLKESLSYFIETEIENKAAIIGDMLELGEISEEEHLRIVELAQETPKVQFFFVGKIFGSLAVTGFDHIQHYNSTKEFISQLENMTFKKSNVLIKGSRGIALEETLVYL